MDSQISVVNRFVYLRSGALAGGKAGCLCSAAFIFILFVIVPIILVFFDDSFPFGFSFRDQSSYFTLMPLIAFSLGVIPATLIGTLMGLIFGLSFPYVKRIFVAPFATILIGIFFGLFVALPLIIIWVALLLNSPSEVLAFFTNGTAVILAPFCLVAGLYVGHRLETVT